MGTVLNGLGMGICLGTGTGILRKCAEGEPVMVHVQRGVIAGLLGGTIAEIYNVMHDEGHDNDDDDGLGERIYATSNSEL